MRNPTIQNDDDFAVQKGRIGDVIVKRVAGQWHVYRIGPVTIVDSLDAAIALARRMHAKKKKSPEL
jgi:hypothetical protein